MTANYNAVCGGNDPASYRRKDGKQKRVLFPPGHVHGGEFEGVIGLNNLLLVAETGKDFRRRAWPDFAANRARCRVLIITRYRTGKCSFVTKWFSSPSSVR
jgi:hypothetical protein